MRVACILFSKRNDRLVEFAQACLRFSPQIAVRSADSSSAIFIEIGKCLKLYSEESFLARARVLLKRFALDANIALSNDIPSSLALARYREKFLEDLPIDSLSDFSDPFLNDPTGRKSVSKMIDALKRLGVKTIDQFQAVPSSQIPSRFGSLGLYCRQRLDHGSDLAWPGWQPPERYLERLELQSSDYCADLEPLLFRSKEMLDRLFSRLRGGFFRAEKIRVTLELERSSIVKDPKREWVFNFISPQGTTAGFLPILKERLSWDLQQSPIESCVIAMHCEALTYCVSHEPQRNFFHDRDEYNEAMGSLYGQLQELLGEDRIFWAETTENRLAEKSWVKTANLNGTQASLHGRYPKRPTRLLGKPLPLRVIEDRVMIKGKVYKTKRWSQFERLALDWFSGEKPREYYRVELESGQALWVFSDPDRQYFVHGYFE